MMKPFPDHFVWGTATSAFQVEGAVHEDGRTPSIWDLFCRVPGKVFEMHNGDVACDHYHRFEEDVELLEKLGFRSYRFSISWPRIFPSPGVYNPKGMNFYKRLVRKLKQHGIEPAATIYHWDMPVWLQELGGWTNRDSVAHFELFASKLFEELGGEVKIWITHNEPWCASILSYMYGEHAPGHHDLDEALRAAHHLLLSHGNVVRMYHEGSYGGEIGITLNLLHMEAASEDETDRAAAVRVDGSFNRWFLDPLFRGGYPRDLMDWYRGKGISFEFIEPGDMEIISTSCEFLGINYYTRQIVRADSNDLFLGAGVVHGNHERTEMDWEVYPEGLYRLLRRLADEYTRLPIYITENGAAFPDQLADGRVLDKDRVRYLHSHLKEALRFIEEGGNLRGYFCWSFLDNFEWAHGYSKRFGLTYVDYETQKRIPKLSAQYMQVVMEMNALPL